jgi:Tfp pilus assembly protein PilF
MTPPRIRRVPAVWFAAFALILACGGCSQGIKGPALGERPGATHAQVGTPERAGVGEQVLERGIASYEDGEYRAAERQLQTALDMGLAAPGDQAKAHKYLAFIHCAAGRAKRCREEFRKALGAEPSFDLEPAEAGHPAWGPMFRSVKANRV